MARSYHDYTEQQAAQERHDRLMEQHYGRPSYYVQRAPLRYCEDCHCRIADGQRCEDCEREIGGPG